MNPDFRTAITPDWITVLLLVSLLILALARHYFTNRFLSFVALPFNNKYLALTQAEAPLSGFHVLISIFQLINTALFLYFFSRQVGLHLFPIDSGGSYLKFFLGVGGWLSLKILLQWTQGYVFDIHSFTTNLIFSKTAYFNYSGMIFFAGNLLLAYVRPDSSVLTIAFALVALVVNVLGMMTLIRQYWQRIYVHFMYFILYICTLEIAPLVLVGGYLNT